MSNASFTTVGREFLGRMEVCRLATVDQSHRFDTTGQCLTADSGKRNKLRTT
jgi:hypothetical protein